MKKLLWSLFCVGWIVPAGAFPKEHVIDSLENALASTTVVSDRTDILLCLKDLTESTDREMFYSRALFEEAVAAGDAFATGSALGTLAAACIGDPHSIDSLDGILRRVEPLLHGSDMEGITEYYRMVRTARRIQDASTEESVIISQRYLDSISTCPPGNVYERASQLFLTGVAAYKLASADGKVLMRRGLPYWNDEQELLSQMKPTARRNFQANLLTCLLAAYGEKKDRKSLTRAADDYLAMLDAYFSDEEIVRRRPYMNKELSYVVCYYSMCTSPLVGRREAETYYERYRNFVQSSGSNKNFLVDKRWFYTISIAYCERWGDYEKEMAYNDSLIMISRPGGMSALLAGMYDRKAKLFERMGRYREACEVYNEQIALRDSLSKHRYDQKIGELEVQYNLEKIERDRASILAQKRKISLWFAFVIIVLALVAVVYLWRNLIRIKRLQRDLRIESQRALESDRLKSDFMGSMSHEIRTPLNAINGFAELIAEGNLSKEECAEFAQIIHDNTRLFTALINDMLEVAQLDNTVAELPRTPQDICRIFRDELDRLPPKDGVEYRLECGSEGIVVPLHRSYTCMLVRELLANAVKFTEQGTIAVSCDGIENNVLTFSVTDTGCGIPPEAAEKVFERFYKIDPFAQGLGLGLSLCRLIVEKFGGEIRLDESYTEGARFIVMLRV